MKNSPDLGKRIFLKYRPIGQLITDDDLEISFNNRLLSGLLPYCCAPNGVGQTGDVQ
jgi:hypothetical protein